MMTEDGRDIYGKSTRRNSGREMPSRPPRLESTVRVTEMTREKDQLDSNPARQKQFHQKQQ